MAVGRRPGGRATILLDGPAPPGPGAWVSQGPLLLVSEFLAQPLKIGG